MKYVTLRDFQLKPSDYMDELPIVLTRYNEPIASVIPYNQALSENEQSGNSPNKPEVLTNKSTDTKIMRRCQAPGINCKNQGHKYKVSFYTDEGMKSKELHLCGKHLRAARDQAEKVEET